MKLVIFVLFCLLIVVNGRYIVKDINDDDEYTYSGWKDLPLYAGILPYSTFGPELDRIPGRVQQQADEPVDEYYDDVPYLDYIAAVDQYVYPDEVLEMKTLTFLGKGLYEADFEFYYAHYNSAATMVASLFVIFIAAVRLCPVRRQRKRL